MVKVLEEIFRDTCNNKCVLVFFWTGIQNLAVIYDTAIKFPVYLDCIFE